MTNSAHHVFIGGGGLGLKHLTSSQAKVVTPDISQLVDALCLLTDPDHALGDWAKGEVKFRARECSNSIFLFLREW